MLPNSIQQSPEDHKAAAEESLRKRLVDLVEAGQPVVLDHSFWRRTTRDHYKAPIESHGCRWELIYLRTSPATLRQRLAVRNKLHGANSVTVSEDLLNRYLAGFEEPVDEGELTILQDRCDQPRGVRHSSCPLRARSQSDQRGIAGRFPVQKPESRKSAQADSAWTTSEVVDASGVITAILVCCPQHGHSRCAHEDPEHTRNDLHPSCPVRHEAPGRDATRRAAITFNPYPPRPRTAAGRMHARCPRLRSCLVWQRPSRRSQAGG
ncbi:AAA family ATPase [Nonomuraea roseola]|uniref:AAA family ATPase n=1 Tax=Nonomuraea roseola TaxID=46179 RepID=A0ABV5PZG6_9ACTN